VQNFTSMGDGMAFATAGFLGATSPYVVVETIQFHVGADSFRMKALEALWRDEVESARRDGALVFGVYGDPRDGTRFFTLGAYGSEAAFRAHKESESGGSVYSRIETLGGDIETVLLEKKGGFLYKNGTTCG
jgi:quinol monooxygenase YgiN